MRESDNFLYVPLLMRLSKISGFCRENFGEQDPLPMAVEFNQDGLVLSRRTLATEVHSETTDNS